jgi:hypothetical protein
MVTRDGWAHHRAPTSSRVGYAGDYWEKHFKDGAVGYFAPSGTGKTNRYGWTLYSKRTVSGHAGTVGQAKCDVECAYERLARK